MVARKISTLKATGSTPVSGYVRSLTVLQHLFFGFFCLVFFLLEVCDLVFEGGADERVEVKKEKKSGEARIAIQSNIWGFI